MSRLLLEEWVLDVKFFLVVAVMVYGVSEANGGCFVGKMCDAGA